MKFNSNSAILNGGCRVHIDVYIPAFLLDYNIDDEIWQEAIDTFNKKLSDRPSVTSTINGVNVDVIKVESVADSSDFLKMGAIILLLVAKEEDVIKIADIHFCLTGYLTFKDRSGIVEKMVIKNITYGGEDSKKFRILDDSDDEHGEVSG